MTTDKPEYIFNKKLQRSVMALSGVELAILRAAMEHYTRTKPDDSAMSLQAIRITEKLESAYYDLVRKRA